MCGIVGIITENAKDYHSTVSKMCKTLHHRGPDDSGIVCFDNAIIAHTRLSIVDIEGGFQPKKVGSVGVTFNGEIYGYQDLKKQFSNYNFESESDTELLFALYETFGFQMCKHLPGMFAFGIWDDKKQSLLCGRDRFGEKPLFYAYGRSGEFIFSSEIKAIISSGLLDVSFDNDNLSHYLQYLYTHPSKTIYKNIYPVLPGNILIYDKKGVSQKRYWEFPKINTERSYLDSISTFKSLFNNAIKKQLIADVEVGAFLSGGLDSSTVVAVAKQFSPSLKTFSFKFREHFDETKYASQIAEKYQTDHYELHDDQDIGELIVKMQEVYDEPFADSSNIATYLISKCAKNYVDVVLTGDGADELLGGYSWYKNLYHMNPFQSVLSGVFQFFNVCGPFREGTRLYRRWKHDFQRAHLSQKRYFSLEECHTLFEKNINLNHFEPTSQNTLEGILEEDVTNYMVGDILVKTDRAAMAHSLELRAPFLDKDVAEFCFSLPFDHKVTFFQDKRLLRDTFGDLWTPDIRNRPKQGFGAPVNTWLELPSVKGLVHDFLEKKSAPIYNIFDFNTVRPYLNHNNYHKWTLLVLSVWMATR